MNLTWQPPPLPPYTCIHSLWLPIQTPRQQFLYQCEHDEVTCRLPGSSRLATSSASRNKGPEQGQPASTSIPALFVNRWADNNPPKTTKKGGAELKVYYIFISFASLLLQIAIISFKYIKVLYIQWESSIYLILVQHTESITKPHLLLIFVSKTDALMSRSKFILSMTNSATLRNSVWLPIIASVSNASIRVSE